MRRFGTTWIALITLAAATALADEPKKDAAKDAARDAAKVAGRTPPAAPVRPAAKETAERPQPPAPENLAQAMTRLARIRVDVDFRETSLSDAAKFLAQVARMNVILSPALQAKGADALPRIELKLTKVTLRQLAEILAKTTETRLVVRDGILQFTTVADARGKPILRIYPLADLTMPIRNFPGPDINLHLASVEFEDEKESDVESAFDDPEEIVETIRKMTGEGTWDDDDVSISADQRKLVVRQYAEVHREIARLLLLLRAVK